LKGKKIDKDLRNLPGGPLLRLLKSETTKLGRRPCKADIATALGRV
jgi:hypothetical protein